MAPVGLRTPKLIERQKELRVVLNSPVRIAALVPIADVVDTVRRVGHDAIDRLILELLEPVDAVHAVDPVGFHAELTCCFGPAKPYLSFQDDHLAARVVGSER